MQGINAETLTIVMDSVMDISVFEVSITLFKRLYVSILRGLEIQIVMDDR